MGTTCRAKYCGFWIDHGVSDNRQPAECIGVFDGDQIYPKSNQTRERLSSDHLKFAKRLPAVKHIVFESHAEVSDAAYKAVAKLLR